LNSHVKWKTGDAPLIPAELPPSKWTLVVSDALKKTKGTTETKLPASMNGGPEVKKRKANGPPEKAARTKKAKISVPPPNGTLWDSQDYSCAYDSMFAIMYDIWHEHGPKWTDRFGAMGKYTKMLAQRFQAFKSRTGRLEDARDNVRSSLARGYPLNFRYGPELTAIDDLALRIFRDKSWGRA
jgi:hypothetical protein